MTVSIRIKEHNSTLLPALTLGGILIVAWFVYSPGLSGGFLFDDWGNLPPLGALGPIDNWHALVTYLLSGIASATGRPIAMLSFLIDANNWPAPPEPFKYTNILIELLNGTLLTWLTFKLARLFNIGDKRAAWVAVLSAGMWLLHPLMVSTTLFVVQRMAMLAATFVFAGLLCYLRGRRLLVRGRSRAGYLWMSVGIGLCGLLATLSKENGALLPVFVLVIERFVVQQPGSELRMERALPGWRLWKTVFLYLPLSLLAGYLLFHLPSMLHEYSDSRNFTLSERLLTEARILVHYLYVLFIPRAYTAGLFHDDIPLSTGLFHPWTTLPAIMLIAGLFVLGWRARKRHPALSLAIFFYFGGQLLESTFIPLELYFEHRNYLPAAFLFFPLALWIVTGPRLTRHARVLISAAVLAGLASLTWMRADLWGHPFQQALVWAHEDPGSPRAQSTLSLYLMRQGNYAGANQILKNVADAHPDNVMVQLNRLTALCGLGDVSRTQLHSAAHALAHAKVGARVAYNAIGKFISYYSAKRCSGLDPVALNTLIQAALNNPHVSHDSGWRQNMLALRGRLQLAQGHVSMALRQFEKSLAAQARPGAALYEAALLGTMHHPHEALALLRYFKGLQPWTPQGFDVAHLRSIWLAHERYYPDQMAHMERVLRAAIDKHNQKTLTGSIPQSHAPRNGTFPTGSSTIPAVPSSGDAG